MVSCSSPARSAVARTARRNRFSKSRCAWPSATSMRFLPRRAAASTMWWTPPSSWSTRIRASRPSGKSRPSTGAKPPTRPRRPSA
ncbi:UNVERIFIED_CONTAM: hypothetical protein NCL1_58817 [Trichonephila clavipes]